MNTATVSAFRPEPAANGLALADLVPPATLVEAREHRDALARLLAREREAAADFLLALADLDHVLPLALGGRTTFANLRCACAAHNRYAAEVALGEAVVEAARGRNGRRAARR